LVVAKGDLWWQLDNGIVDGYDVECLLAGRAHRRARGQFLTVT
jgi:hypothetical protein